MIVYTSYTYPKDSSICMIAHIHPYTPAFTRISLHASLHSYSHILTHRAVVINVIVLILIHSTFALFAIYYK
jgi:hypothetical protein